MDPMNGMVTKAKVKICGITNLRDAELVVETGADLLGFNFYSQSPRYIEPTEAAAIINALSGQVEMVGLFVNAGVERISEVLKVCRLTMIQLHGDESNEECRAVSQLGLPVIKGLRIKQPADIEQINQYDTEYILLDAFHEELYGGSGQSFDWDWIRHTGGKKIFLAGGIHSKNVQQALRAGTWGIDLCSGIESEPGMKDPEKTTRLFDEIMFFYD